MENTNNSLKIQFEMIDDEVNCQTSFSHVSFEEAEAFIIRCIDELNRQLNNKEKCPFNKKQ